MQIIINDPEPRNPFTATTMDDTISPAQSQAIWRAANTWRVDAREMSGRIFGTEQYEELKPRHGSTLITAIEIVGRLKQAPDEAITVDSFARTLINRQCSHVAYVLDFLHRKRILTRSPVGYRLVREEASK